METDLSLNGHNLNGSVHYLHGFLNTKNKKKNQLYFVLNGSSQVLIPANSILLNITILSRNIMGPFPAISLKFVSDDFPPFISTSTKAKKKK